MVDEVPGADGDAVVYGAVVEGDVVDGEVVEVSVRGVSAACWQAPSARTSSPGKSRDDKEAGFMVILQVSDEK